MISSTETPYFLEMANNVSPVATVCSMVFPEATAVAPFFNVNPFLLIFNISPILIGTLSLNSINSEGLT
ncbi:hypothetical protein D3C79_952640 [compost metagenome]